MSGKWHVRASRSVFRDRWIDVRADDCVTGSGQEISPYYVLTYPDWVHVVALTPDDRLVLVRQYRHAVGECVLELPGGVVDAEDGGLEQAARRELAEETGYRASDWRFVSSLYPNPATHTNRVHFYLATGAEYEGPQILDEGEDGMTVHLVPVSEILSGLHTGILGQVMHVSAVLLGLALAGRIKLRD